MPRIKERDLYPALQTLQDYGRLVKVVRALGVLPINLDKGILSVSGSINPNAAENTSENNITVSKR